MVTGARRCMSPTFPRRRALRFAITRPCASIEDKEHGYEYPDLYRNLFGEDYVPLPHMQADYKMLKNHKWYLEPRMVTVNDLYAFEPGVVVTYRALSRYHRQAFQAAERRPRQRWQSCCPHVAHDFHAGQSPVGYKWRLWFQVLQRFKRRATSPRLSKSTSAGSNTRTASTSIARMRSPAGWEEPGQKPEFDEFTVVLKGMLRVKTATQTLDVRAGQAVIVDRGEWVQYSSPEADGAEYIAVCLPAFSPDTVHRDA